MKTARVGGKSSGETVESAATRTSLLWRIKPGWIVSTRKDLFWFIGSAGFGYAVLALYAIAHVPLYVLVPVWAVVFDETHTFATISRTYLDREELRQRRRLLWGSLAFLITAGPLIIIVGLGDLLEVVTAMWAYHHLVKQHYGFMIMYKKKNDDLLPADNGIDRAFFYTACWYPFLTLPLHDQEAKGLVFSAFTNNTDHLPGSILSAAGLFQNALFTLLIIATGVYITRQSMKLLRGRSLDLPKQALFLAVLPLHYLALRYAAVAAWVGRLTGGTGINLRLQSAPLGIIGVVAVLTIYHNVQYHGIVWHYNKNRYRGDGARERYGMAAYVNIRLHYYAAFALLYAFMFDVMPRFILPNFLGRQSPGWNNTEISNQLFAYLFAWPGLLHYWLDSRIWKVRRDPQLSKTLNLNTA